MQRLLQTVYHLGDDVRDAMEEPGLMDLLKLFLEDMDSESEDLENEDPARRDKKCPDVLSDYEGSDAMQDLDTARDSGAMIWSECSDHYRGEPTTASEDGDTMEYGHATVFDIHFTRYEPIMSTGAWRSIRSPVTEIKRFMREEQGQRERKRADPNIEKDNFIGLHAWG